MTEAVKRRSQYGWRADVGFPGSHASLRRPEPQPAGLVAAKERIVVGSAAISESSPGEWLIVKDDGEETSISAAWLPNVAALKEGDEITMYFISDLQSRRQCIGTDLNGRRLFRLVLDFPRNLSSVSHPAFDGRGPRGA